MDLQKELSLLKSYMGGKNEETFKRQADFINENFTSKADQKIIKSFISDLLSEISVKTEKLIQETESYLVSEQLKEISEIVSMSYIAKNYFNKKRSWIYQKINGNHKNGKQVKFTDSEIQTFNSALKDISNKIGSIAIHS